MTGRDGEVLVTEELVEKACRVHYGASEHPHPFSRQVDDLRRDGMRRVLDAVAPDIAAAARPPVCADGCQLAGWLAESAQQATGPSRPDDPDRLRARRDGLLAVVEERVRRECARELRELVETYDDATLNDIAQLADRWSGSGRTPAGEQG